MLLATRPDRTRTFLLLACCALVVASGCRRRPGAVQNDPAPAEPAVVEVPVVAEPEPAPVPAPPPPLRVTVLLSDGQPHNVSVRDALLPIAGARNVTVHELGGSDQPSASLLAEIGGPESVIAIGLAAARVAGRLDGAKVVFCQIFNYQENGLPGDDACGVETMPDLGPAVRAWKELDPQLARIGVITGPGQARRLSLASTQLREHGVELVYRVTNSDKETLLEFQRLLEVIDGYWMFPDNRVLSSSTIREIMALSKRYRIGVMANDPGFHRIGALICAASRPEEVAAEAWALLKSARDLEHFDHPTVRPLSDAAVTIRADVAEQLGLAAGRIPADMLAR